MASNSIPNRLALRQQVRRQLGDTTARWWSDAELNEYLEDWIRSLNSEFEYQHEETTVVLATNTFAVSSFGQNFRRVHTIFTGDKELPYQTPEELWRGSLHWATEAGPKPLAWTTETFGVIRVWPTSTETTTYQVEWFSYGTWTGLRNGGFEQKGQFWSTSGPVGFSSGYVNEGDWAVLATAAGTQAYIEQTVGGTAGTVYTMARAVYNASEGDVLGAIIFLDSSGTVIGSATDTVAPNGAYGTYTLTATAPALTAEVVFRPLEVPSTLLVSGALVDSVVVTGIGEDYCYPQLPAWTKWSAVPYCCMRAYMSLGPNHDVNRALRWRARYERWRKAFMRIKNTYWGGTSLGLKFANKQEMMFNNVKRPWTGWQV